MKKVVKKLVAKEKAMLGKEVKSVAKKVVGKMKKAC
jgi:hypothetical protein